MACGLEDMTFRWFDIGETRESRILFVCSSYGLAEYGEVDSAALLFATKKAVVATGQNKAYHTLKSIGGHVGGKHVRI